MAYEKCPNCGSDKNQLNACKSCGFTKRSISEPSSRPPHKKRAQKSIKVKFYSPVKKHKKTLGQPKNSVTGPVTCLLCKKTLTKAGNLQGHIDRAHNENKRTKKSNRRVGYSSPRLSRESAVELLAVMEEANQSFNKEIMDYLKRNPSKDGIGKFGVPQDKYRYNFFGCRSMSRDDWRKNGK